MLHRLRLAALAVPCTSALMLALASPAQVDAPGSHAASSTLHPPPSTLVPPSTPFIPEAEAQTHLTRRIQPAYPDAAAEQNIAGTVFLRITVNQSGQVAHIYPIGGPELLIPAAAEAVRRWQFAPFLADGKPAEIHTNLHVPFGELAAAAEQARLLASYRPLWKACLDPEKAAAHAAGPQQLEACRTAASVAEQFTPGTRAVERRQSAQLYAVTLARSGDAKQAALWAAKALPLFAEPPSDAPAAVATALLLAQTRAASGDTLAASRTLADAELRLREALSNAANPDLRRLYTAALRNSLQFHANLLTLLRNPSAAQRKLHEADAL